MDQNAAYRQWLQFAMTQNNLFPPQVNMGAGNHNLRMNSAPSPNQYMDPNDLVSHMNGNMFSMPNMMMGFPQNVVPPHQMAQAIPEYSVGELVWVKANKPYYWPSVVLDPTKVPNLGLGEYAYIHPSNVKSWGPNFEECSRKSRSKTFSNGIQKANEYMADQSPLNTWNYGITMDKINFFTPSGEEIPVNGSSINSPVASNNRDDPALIRHHVDFTPLRRIVPDISEKYNRRKDLQHRVIRYLRDNRSLQRNVH